MNPIIELLKQNDGRLFTNVDGYQDTLKLHPPMADEEIKAFEAVLPCPIPDDIIELLQFSRGFDIGGGLESIEFTGSGGFGIEEIFPCAIDIAHDGFGNFWVVDLTSESKSWGPIFYACHDAPVIVFQTFDFKHFLEELIRFGNDPWKSELDDTHEGGAIRVWKENPDVLSYIQCMNSQDDDLRMFASSLDETFEFIDLRNPRLGDGFSWGRYGAKTTSRRFGNERLFAIQKKSWGRRFLHALR